MVQHYGNQKVGAHLNHRSQDSGSMPFSLGLTSINPKQPHPALAEGKAEPRTGK